jgi:sugar phosphate isomerase/epimerase
MLPVDLKLATADYSFPLLEWEHTLSVARDMGLQGIDISLFENRSHLQPLEILSAPSRSAARVCAALQHNGLELADVFGIPGTRFEQNSPNDPDETKRKKSAEYFYRILEFAVRCNARHLTLLPGVHFPEESQEDSLKRAADELEWRAQAAGKVGVRFAIEPHFGSVVPTPAQAQRLLELAPTLSLTLDPSHFTYQGIPDDDIMPLVVRTSHFHARCARQGKLQAPLEKNTIDFVSYLSALERQGYSGWIALEYVWIDWEHCNEVDNLSETVLLRNLFRAANARTKTVTSKGER